MLLSRGRLLTFDDIFVTLTHLWLLFCDIFTSQGCMFVANTCLAIPLFRPGRSLSAPLDSRGTRDINLRRVGETWSLMCGCTEIFEFKNPPDQHLLQLRRRNANNRRCRTQSTVCAINPRLD